MPRHLFTRYLKSILKKNITTYLNGKWKMDPSRIHLLISLLKVVLILASHGLSFIGSIVLALVLISSGSWFHSLEAKKLKLLLELFLNRGTVRYLLVVVLGSNLSLIFLDEPRLMAL